MRELMLTNPDHGILPVEVRATAADDAYLSPNHGRDSLVITWPSPIRDIAIADSVSGAPRTQYEPFLRDLHQILAKFQ